MEPNDIAESVLTELLAEERAEHEEERAAWKVLREEMAATLAEIKAALGGGAPAAVAASVDTAPIMAGFDRVLERMGAFERRMVELEAREQRTAQPITVKSKGGKRTVSVTVTRRDAAERIENADVDIR